LRGTAGRSQNQGDQQERSDDEDNAEDCVEWIGFGAVFDQRVIGRQLRF